jgi:hypothetical protein
MDPRPAKAASVLASRDKLARPGSKGMSLRRFMALSAAEKRTSSALRFPPKGKSLAGQAGVRSFTSFAHHAVPIDHLADTRII